MVDLKAQLARIRPEVDEALARVLGSTAFVFGEDVRRLEEEFARFCGTAHACAVANGTDALHLSLRAYGIGPGDEVVTVANTFIGTGEAILLAGAKPVFVDVDPVSYTMDPSKLEAALTPRTRLVLPVHLYGHPADMTAIEAWTYDRFIAPAVAEFFKRNLGEILDRIPNRGQVLGVEQPDHR